MKRDSGNTVALTLGQVEPCTVAMMGAGNLNRNQSKALIYYCAMTWSDEPKIRPIININGESASGKSGVMKQMKVWSKAPVWITARNMTPATLRDSLADTVTVFVEEADKTTDPIKAENYYQNRYDESGKAIPYKRQTVNEKGYQINVDETHNHFGYTILCHGALKTGHLWAAQKRPAVGG